MAKAGLSTPFRLALISDILLDVPILKINSFRQALIEKYKNNKII